MGGTIFVESIEFRREKGSELEKGWYVGETDNAHKSVLLDADFIPLVKDENGCSVWDYHIDTDDWKQFRC